jgi:hypothetical protein
VSTVRTVSAWGLAAILVFFLAALLASITATQLTSEDTGKRVLRRSVAVMADIDATLPRIESELHANAAATESPTVQVPSFPILVTLTREEAQALSGNDLRERLLDDSADKLYSDGSAAWSSGDPEATRSIERVSTAGVVDRGLGLVRDKAHTGFLVLTLLLAVIVAGMVIGLVVALPRDARLVVLGGVTLASSLPLLAAAVAMRFAFRTADADGDPFVDGMLSIGADSMWVPIRNFFTIALLGAGLLITGLLLIWWEAKRMPRGGHLADTGY